MCGSVEELLALAKEAKIPLPDEMLAVIAGGKQPDPENCEPGVIKCPKCESTNTKLEYTEKDPNYDWSTIYHYYCYNCAYTWVTIKLAEHADDALRNHVPFRYWVFYAEETGSTRAVPRALTLHNVCPRLQPR